MPFVDLSGAVKKWIELQNKGDNLIVMLADLHAVTLPREPDALRYRPASEPIDDERLLV